MDQNKTTYKIHSLIEIIKYATIVNYHLYFEQEQEHDQELRPAGPPEADKENYQ